MSSASKSLYEESLNDSWVEVSRTEVTPVSCFLGSGVENMLLDAQKEGSESSGLSSNESPEHGSVEGPTTPRTPTPSSGDHPGLNVLSTQSGIARRKQGSTDWIWDWSSRPDIQPPKEWNFHHPTKPSLSIRNSKAVKYLFSNEILSLFIISNLMSLVIGFGFGYSTAMYRIPQWDGSVNYQLVSCGYIALLKVFGYLHAASARENIPGAVVFEDICLLQENRTWGSNECFEITASG